MFLLDLLRNLPRIVIYTLQDLYPKVSRKFLLAYSKRDYFSKNSLKSDSEMTNYLNSVRDFLVHPSEFGNFRRRFEYREILEHVTYKQGREYLALIHSYGKDLENQKLLDFASEESTGNPRKFFYDNGKKVSPTTLRYIAIANEINFLFGDLTGLRVGEIGIGYGGQANILTKMYTLRTYLGYDLAEVIELSNLYLQKEDSNFEIAGMDIHALAPRKLDLLISNYAFSELPIQIQMNYMTKLINRASSGYMIMNSGIFNRTGRSEGKLPIHQLVGSLDNWRILDEKVPTGPDNYLLIWGDHNFV
jgi:putative sugar O-methyltransferase